jgi:virginiamycin B lyase
MGSGSTAVLETWTVPTSDPLLSEIALGPGETVYFTEFNGGKVGRLDPLGGTITEWSVGSTPSGLTLDPSGTGIVYFTDDRGNRVGRLNPSMNAYSTESVPTPNARPTAVLAEQTGMLPLALWFTERGAGKLGVLNVSGFVFDALLSTIPTQNTVMPASTTLTPTVRVAAVRHTPGNPALPPPIALAPATTTGPFTEWEVLLGGSGRLRALAQDPSGGLWLTTETNTLLRFDSGNVSIYNLPAGQRTVAVAVGSAGKIWYASDLSNLIGRLDPTTGDITEWLLDARQVYALALDPTGSGAVWFSDREGDQVGRLDPATGQVEYFSLSADTHPLDIVVGLGGEVWFVSERQGTVHRLSFSGIVGPPPTPPGTDAILGVSVTPVSATEVDVTIQYSYSGSRGTPVFAGAWPTQGGTRHPDFGYVPARIDAPGSGTVTVRVRYLGSSCLNTDGLDIFLYDSGGTVFLTQNFPALLQWACTAGPPPPPSPPPPVGLSTVTLTIDRGCGANYNPGDPLTISISVSESATVTLLDFEPSQRIKQFALGTLAPGMTRTITGTVTGPAGVETLVAVARTASGIYVSTGCSFGIGGVSPTLVSMTLDRGCDGLYHYNETATVTLNSSVTGWATLFNVTRTGQIKQLFLGRPIQAGVPLTYSASIGATTGRSTLVAYVRDTAGRNITTHCSMNVVP